MFASVFILALLLAFSTACSFSSLHAHCQLTWKVAGTQCTTFLGAIAGQFSHCCADNAIGTNYRNYHLDNLDNQALTVSGHIKFTDGYIDKQTISAVQSGNDCIATACSQSKSLSYYDYDANFCDVFNLVRGLGFNYTQQVSNCRFQPDQGKEVAVCNKQ
eukprot:TRINITY_DN1282_c0_g1_i1.p1 TRINITY_DN1282_c0_g1~~TRINITY_DN1282_c0_g1_i1.p1  ORF type:complete len:175 (-),score=22.55 TRINITY_DN1282_c0_g1_i1:35-514(-)